MHSLEAGTIAGFQAGFIAVIQPGFGLEILLIALQESEGRHGHGGGRQKYLTLYPAAQYQAMLFMVTFC